MLFLSKFFPIFNASGIAQGACQYFVLVEAKNHLEPGAFGYYCAAG
jgi:hypothetical protein